MTGLQYGIRFENSEQAQSFMFQLAEEVARRLETAFMRDRHLTLKIMKRDPDAPKEPSKACKSLPFEILRLILYFS